MGELLKDKVCIVTGSARGIGKEIALLFAAEGAEVIVNGTRPGSADAWISESSYKANLHPFYFDITDAAAVRQNVMAVKKQFGRIDVLVNNAGMLSMSPVTDVSREEWEKVFKVNVTAALYLTQLVAPVMKERVIR
jgi:3-oxoacyl-[acyl-carrier protein] reductase